MDSSQHLLEDPVKGSGGYQNITVDNTLQEAVTQIAYDGLISSQEFKQRRMETIAMYERLYNNDIPPKMRQLFNVPVPVFPGMIDTMLADFNDEINLKFKPTNTAQYLVIPKVQALWEAERDSMAPNAMWNYKARTDRFNAMLSGRGIIKNYAENDPYYRNIFEVVNYSDFHCQPMGGGNLENHLFAGQEGIFRTIEDLETDPSLNQEQVKKLKDTSNNSTDFQTILNNTGTKLARFTSQQLNPENNSYAGARTFNLCEFIVTYKGVRYLVFFEPITKTWLKVKKWTDIRPSGRYMWISWATHEDHKVFWSKGYADDLFHVADAIITMVNQELTNREKKNYNSRAYDSDMFPDAQKLDEAQYMPDTLVPAKVGAKQISQGIYEFQTPELNGTINLVNFLSSYTGQQTGITAGAQGQNAASKKPTVVVSEQKELSKRTGLRSDSYREAYSQLGESYIENLREFMPPRVSVQMIGEKGFIEEGELRRIEVRRAGLLGCTVMSTSEQENRDVTKKQNRINAITMIRANPQASKYEKELILRDIGGFDDTEVNFFLDSESYESQKQIAHASENIQNMLNGKATEIYYGADVSYLMYIENYIVDNKNMLKGKEQRFVAHLKEMFPVVANNMRRKAQMQIMKKTMESFMQTPMMPGMPTEGQKIPQSMPSGMGGDMGGQVAMGGTEEEGVGRGPMNTLQ